MRKTAPIRALTLILLIPALLLQLASCTTPPVQVSPAPTETTAPRTPAPEPVPTPAETIPSGADVYESKRGGFRFPVPAGWSTEPSDSEKSWQVYVAAPGNMTRFWFISSPTAQDDPAFDEVTDDVLNDRMAGFCASIKELFSREYEPEDGLEPSVVTVGGRKLYRAVFYAKEPGTGVRFRIAAYAGIYHGRIYLMSAARPEDVDETSAALLDAMAESVQLFEPEPAPSAQADSLAGRKTYTNEAFKVSFDYPADWQLTENNDYAPRVVLFARSADNTGYFSMILDPDTKGGAPYAGRALKDLLAESEGYWKEDVLNSQKVTVGDFFSTSVAEIHGSRYICVGYDSYDKDDNAHVFAREYHGVFDRFTLTCGLYVPFGTPVTKLSALTEIPNSVRRPDAPAAAGEAVYQDKALGFSFPRPAGWTLQRNDFSDGDTDLRLTSAGGSEFAMYTGPDTMKEPDYPGLTEEALQDRARQWYGVMLENLKEQYGSVELLQTNTDETSGVKWIIALYSVHPEGSEMYLLMERRTVQNGRVYTLTSRLSENTPEEDKQAVSAAITGFRVHKPEP